MNQGLPLIEYSEIQALALGKEVKDSKFLHLLTHYGFLVVLNAKASENKNEQDEYWPVYQEMLKQTETFFQKTSSEDKLLIGYSLDPTVQESGYIDVSNSRELLRLQYGSRNIYPWNKMLLFNNSSPFYSSFFETYQKYYRLSDQIALHLMFAISNVLKISLSEIIPLFLSNCSTFSTNPLDIQSDPEVSWVQLHHYYSNSEIEFPTPVHTDKNLITLGPPSSFPALEIQTRTGESSPFIFDSFAFFNIEEKIPPGALIVFAGNQMEILTKKKIRAAIHRVKNAGNIPRYSIPFKLAAKGI